MARRRRKTTKRDKIVQSVQHADWEYTDDLIFIFRYCQMQALCDENEYSSEEQKAISNVIDHCSKEITIDKSYVKTDSSKYEKVFITEEGWEKLCKLVHDTQNGSHCTSKQQGELLSVYKMLIQSYLYSMLDDIGYDISFIDVDMKDDTKFMSQVIYDKTKAWRHYPGKWQSW